MNHPYQPPVAALEAQGRLRQLVRHARRLAGSRSAMALLDQVFVSGMSFATSVLVGRANPAALGVFALTLTVINFARAVQGELVSGPFTVYCQHHAGRRLRAYSGSVLAHQLMTTAAVVLGVAAAALVLPLLDAPEGLTSAMLPLLTALPLVLMSGFIRHWCFARLRFGSAAAVDALLGAMQIGGLAWLTASRRMTVENALYVIALASLASVIAWAARFRHEFHIRPRAAVVDWVRNWRFARWTLASQLIGCSTPWLLPWAVSLTHGEQQTGLLAACVTTVGLSMTLVMAVANALTPTAARAYVERGRRGLSAVLAKAAVTFVAAVGAFVVALLLSGDLLVVAFYGSQYAGTAVVCQLLAAGVLLNSLSIVAGNGLWALDKPQWNLPADAAVLLFTLAAAVLLIPGWGIVGAATASLIGAGCGAAVRSVTLFHLLANDHES